MALAKPFEYKIGGIFHPSSNTAEPSMYAYTPTGKWEQGTNSSAWWSGYSGAKFYYHFHPGVDLFAQLGTPIHAMEAGLVTKAGWSSNASGYAVNVDIRWNAPITRYVHGHMKSVSVKVGQKVARGQLLGYVGQSGYATGPHAHTGLQIGSRLYNVLLFFEGGARQADPAIKPYTSVRYASVKGAGINIRTSPDLDVGSTNIYATSRPDGIYRSSLRIGALTYKFTYQGDVSTDDGVFIKCYGFSRTLYIYKSLVNIS